MHDISNAAGSALLVSHVL
jgi:hypothetical protein